MPWDTSLARSVTFTVRVSGVIRPHEPESITWGQDITSDMPDAVTAGGQVAHRSGSVTWARQQLVETRTPNPWYQRGYWIPEVGEPVTIDAHDGTNTVRVFTGVIDTVEGDAFGNRSSRLVADIRGADKVVRYQSLTRYGSPVAAPTGNGEIRRQATTPVWLVNEIARDLGYHATPPAPAASKVILDAPLQGSTYNYFQSTPNAEMVVSHRTGAVGATPLWSYGRDGFGISNATVEWVPRTGGGTGAWTLGVSILVYAGHQSDALVRIYHGTNTDTYLRILADKTVRVSTYVGGTTTSHNLPALPLGDGPHRVSAVYRSGNIRVRYGGNDYTVPAPSPGAAVTRISLEAGGLSCVAGLQVWEADSNTDHNAPDWTPTARFRYGTGTHTTVCTPSVRDRRARDVLDEYASALLSPIWVDANGALQVVTGQGLHDQAPAVTVDALKDVSDLAYSVALLDHRPTVEVDYEHAHHSNAFATTARTKVWQGSGGEVSPDAVDETFVEVPEDEEWIMLSDPAQPSRLTFDTRDAFNAGAGTWWGLSEDVTAPDYLTPVVNGSLVAETLTPWAWKYTTTYGNENGAVQKAPTSAYIKTRYREMDLPIIRARSLVRYEPRTVSAIRYSARYPGTLRHDTGKWVTTSQQATDLAQWIHSMVSVTTPILKNLVIRFNPLADVGTKVAIQAQDVFGVDFEALILSADHNPGDDTTTVTARVTKVTAFTDTIDDVDYAHIGQSLARWDADRTGKTLDQVAANPYL